MLLQASRSRREDVSLFCLFFFFFFLNVELTLVKSGESIRAKIINLKTLDGSPGRLPNQAIRQHIADPRCITIIQIIHFLMRNDLHYSTTQHK